MLHLRTLRSRTRLLLAAALGMLAGCFFLGFLALPAWSLLALFWQETALDRLRIGVRILSPFLGMIAISAWAWILYPLGAQTVRKLMAWCRALSWQSLVPQTVVLPSAKPATSVPSFSAPGSEEPEWSSFRSTPPPSLIAKDEVALQQEGKSTEQPLESDLLIEPQQAAEQEVMLDHEKPDLVGEHVPQTVCIQLSLLNTVKATLSAQGMCQQISLRPGENNVRLVIQAYIAWMTLKSGRVERDAILEALAVGRRKDYDTNQLGWVFSDIKKYLREDLRKARDEFNQHQGTAGMTDKIDFFVTKNAGLYGLHPACRIVDLEAIEKQYEVIRSARKAGKGEQADETVPQDVLTACERLIEAYSGDFLQQLLEDHPEEFRAWVREPYTLYRDYYLDALWIQASHERALSLQEQEERGRRHQARAAQLYYDYATYATNSQYDTKLRFAHRSKTGEHGARVQMAERAIRRCLVLLGHLGKTDMVDQVYQAFLVKMAALSENQWKPEEKTMQDIRAARSTTNAYRFFANS